MRGNGTLPIEPYTSWDQASLFAPLAYPNIQNMINAGYAGALFYLCTRTCRVS